MPSYCPTSDHPNTDRCGHPHPVEYPPASALKHVYYMRSHFTLYTQCIPLLGASRPPDHRPLTPRRRSIYTTRELGPGPLMSDLLEPLTVLEASAIRAEFPRAFTESRAGRSLAPPPSQLLLEVGLLGPEHAKAVEDHLAAGSPALNVPSSSIQQVQTLRFTHHRIAQLLAAGMPDIQVAALCSTTASRISILKTNPAFQELLAYYAENVEEAWADFVTTAAAMSMDMLHRLQELLDESPDKFTPAMTLQALTVLADRSGHAPVTKSVNVNVNADIGSRLNAAKERLRQVGTG